jgi:hypothetical protein
MMQLSGVSSIDPRACLRICIDKQTSTQGDLIQKSDKIVPVDVTKSLCCFNETNLVPLVIENLPTRPYPAMDLNYARFQYHVRCIKDVIARMVLYVS